MRTSTFTSGTIDDAWGEWRVVRAGTVIYRKNKIRDFSWVTREEDDGTAGVTIWCRACNHFGEKGSWQSVALAATAASGASYVQYVDAVSGDNGNAGTSSGSPVQTVAQAKTNIAANLTADGDHIMWIKEGQTHSVTSSSAWAGGTGHVRVQLVRWGTSTTKPVITGHVDQTFAYTGMRHALVVDGLAIDGQDSTNTAQSCIDMSRIGAGTRSAHDVIVFNTDIDGYYAAIVGNDDVIDQTTRANGTSDFFAAVNVAITAGYFNRIYDMPWYRYLLWKDVTIGVSTNVGSTNFWRTGPWSDALIMDCTFDMTGTTGEAGMRFMCNNIGDQPTAGCERITVSGCSYPYSGGIRFHNRQSADDGTFYVTDIHIVDTLIQHGRPYVDDSGGGGPGLHYGSLDGLQIWDSCLGRPLILWPHASAATAWDRIEMLNVAVMIWEASSGEGFANLDAGSASKMASGAIKVRGCYTYWPVDGGGNRIAYSAFNWTWAQLLDKFDTSCDWNHQIGHNGSTLYWALFSDSPFNRQLASWQSATGFDANATSTTSTTLAVTSDGVSTPADPHLTSGSTVLNNAGFPLDYRIDLDEHVVSASTPDAGPHEYGATAVPDDPPLGVSFFGSIGGVCGGRLTA
jgi:hypothetical protein